MNPFMLSSSERLEAWGVFRDGLPEMNESEQLSKVAHFWSQCPYSNWTMDPENTKEWLSVWEILYEGEYCKNAIALGMEATLRFAGWNPERLKLAMNKNTEDGEEFFVLIIDDQHVLNYSHGEVEKVDDIKECINTLYSYQWRGRSFKRAT